MKRIYIIAIIVAALFSILKITGIIDYSWLVLAGLLIVPALLLLFSVFLIGIGCSAAIIASRIFCKMKGINMDKNKGSKQGENKANG